MSSDNFGLEFNGWVLRESTTGYSFHLSEQCLFNVELLFLTLFNTALATHLVVLKAMLYTFQITITKQNRSLLKLGEMI